MLETLLVKSRYLALLTVTITLLAAVVLYFYSSVTGLLAMWNVLVNEPLHLDSAKVLAVSLLKLVDFFFICIGLQIISSGVYKLFIKADVSVPAVMRSESFADLKSTLIRIITVVLLIDFVESAVDQGPSEELMQYGIAIAFVVAAVSWSARSFSESRPDSQSSPRSD